jgi:DNA helicase-2/ATP-dependent DNA helicase PcrA
MEGMARAMMVPLRDLYDRSKDENFSFREVEQVQLALVAYKEANDRMDFTDMIVRFTETNRPPRIRKLIVDEAQDMSACQWKMITMLASHAEETYIAGDDDQAIFRWAGADVDALINLQGQVQVLGQSYRVPKLVAKLAGEVVDRIGNRRPKEWAPRAEDGEINHVYGIDQVDMSHGTWLLLARNGHLLKRYEEYCTMQGYLFSSPNVELLRGPAWECVRAWERLRAGRAVTVQEAVAIYEYMNVREKVTFGYKGKLVKFAKTNPQQSLTLAELRAEYGLITTQIWHEALDRLPTDDKEYFLAALRRGEKMNQEPRIKISTIHGAKGGEAENVVLILEMATKTFAEYQENPEDEARVWYVAITRASQRLFIIQPTTNRCYDL